MVEGIEKDEMGRKFICSDTGVKVFVDFKDNLIVDLDDPLIASQARN
jgi:glycerol-3-phosphate responsive antiterminator